MRSRKTTQRKNLLHQRNEYTETYTAWCCRKIHERATSILRLVMVCTSTNGYKWDRIDIMSLWKHLSPLFTDRLKELNRTLAPSQCWLCRRLSGRALRQNLSRGLFSIWSILHVNTGLMKEYIAFGKPDTSIHYLHLSTAIWVCDNQSEQSWRVRTWMNTPNFKSWSEPRDFASNKWQAKQIRPLAQQLDYLARAPKCTPKEGTMENSPHAKEHLQTTLSFLLHGQMNIRCLLLWLHNNPGSKKQRLFPGLLLLATLCQHQMLVVGPELLAALSAWQCWPQSLWFVHAENAQNPLNMRSRKTLQREICCTKKKYTETETYTAWRCWIRNEKRDSTLRFW